MNRPAHGVMAETHEPTAPVVLRMQNRQLRCRSCWGGRYRILKLAGCCINPLSRPQGLRAFCTVEDYLFFDGSKAVEPLTWGGGD
jgi:hypothetical protein